MDLDIRMQGMKDAEELRLYVERRVRFAFDSFGDAVLWVRVRLEDQNGPKGGLDKACRVTAVARSGLPVLIEEVDADEHAVVSRAVGRAVSALRRALDRARTAHLRKLS
jgi:putative sigma-54 modulation protein